MIHDPDKLTRNVSSLDEVHYVGNTLIVSIAAELLFRCFVILTGLIVNTKLLSNLKKEIRKEKGKVLQRIIKTCSITQMICWPILMLLHWLMRMDVRTLNLLSPIMCETFFSVKLFYVVVRLYVGFNSLVIAIARTLFLVYDQKVDNFGLSKFKNKLYQVIMVIKIIKSLINNYII